MEDVGFCIIYPIVAGILAIIFWVGLLTCGIFLPLLFIFTLFYLLYKQKETHNKVVEIGKKIQKGEKVSKEELEYYHGGWEKTALLPLLLPFIHRISLIILFMLLIYLVIDIVVFGKDSEFHRAFLEFLLLLLLLDVGAYIWRKIIEKYREAR